MAFENTSMLSPCPVDPTAWGKKNRVQLYPEKVNRWVLARTLRDAPSSEQLLESTIAVLGKWFGDSGIGVFQGQAGDVVDNIEIAQEGHIRPVLAHAERREKLDPIPTLVPGPSIYLVVTFNYRGRIQTIPWPVWSSRFSLLRSSKTCPFDTDWMLVEAATDTKDVALPPAPDKADWWDSLEKYSKSNPLGAVQSSLSTLGWVAGVLLGVVALQTIRRIT